MIIVTPMDSVFVLILVTFCSQIHGFYIDENGGKSFTVIVSFFNSLPT